MLLRSLGVFVFALAFSSAAFAHGGGGGGHGGGSHVIFIGGYTGGSVSLVAPDAEIGDTSRIRSVAVLSSFMQTLNLKPDGGIFGSKRVDIDISNWALDDYAAKILAAHFAKRFDVHAIAYDRSALAKIPKGDSNESLTQLHGFFATIQNPGVDAFVVVRPDDPGPYPAVSGLALGTGMGMFPLSEWLGFEIEVFDARTFQRISRCFARAQYRAGLPATFAAFRVPIDRTLDDKLTPTPVQMELMRGDFQHHLAVVIPHTLRAMKLGLPIPDPGDEPLVAIPPQLKPLQQVHNVAVVSAIGDTFDFGYRTVLFQHHTTQVPVADGKLDADIEAMIAAKLDKRFTVKAVPIDRASLGKMSAMITGTTPSPIAGLSPRDDIDAYFVILKRAGVDGNLNDSTTGIGIFKNKPFGGENTYVFAHYEFVVVDAHTLKVLGHRSGIASPHWPSPVPGRPIDNGVWPNGDVDALAPGRDTAVNQELHDVIADSIGETLLSMGLTGMRRDLEDNSGLVAAVATEVSKAADVVQQ